MNEEIEKAEFEIALWAKQCVQDMKFYIGLVQAIEKRDREVLNLIVEIRYGSTTG